VLFNYTHYFCITITSCTRVRTNVHVLCSPQRFQSKRKRALLSLCHCHHLVAVLSAFSVLRARVTHIYTTPIGRKAYGPSLKHLRYPRYSSKTYTIGAKYIFLLKTDDDDFFVRQPHRNIFALALRFENTRI
jgi:hypothetical protein